MTSRLTGARGEQAAARYLRDNGYALLAANYRTKAGEIDIIAEKGKYICFIEVKSRQEGGYLPPRDAVSQKQQQRIADCAEIYMAYRKTKLMPRFDIVEVLMSGDRIAGVNHIEGAF